MSDLQLSLLIIGAAVVGVVYLFNWMQERKFRRKLGAAFDAERDDALLGAAAKGGGRVEPQVVWREAESASLEEPPASPEPGAARPTQAEAIAPRLPPALAPGFDAAIDYVAEIESAIPIAQTAIEEILDRTAACGKPYHAAGVRPGAEHWEALSRGGDSGYTKIQVALQLVNRAGPVSAAQLAMFRDAVRSCASKISASASCPDVEEALHAARQLDAFCAEADIAIGVNIVAADDQTFGGGRIRGLAEATGLKLEPDGVFHFRDEARQTLFTLDNHEPAPFLPEQINSLSTRGITLLLDVPRVADGVVALDRMLETGRRLAQALGGRLVDDNRKVLTEASIAGIRQQLAEICGKMAACGIEAGSTRARRLFS